MAQILLQEIHSARGQEAAHHLLSAGEILLKLLNEIIDFSQWTTVQSPVRQVSFSVPTLIQEVVQLMQPAIAEKKLTLHVKYQRVPATICGDEVRLRQILLNLLSNAVKFTHQGEIHISAKSIERTQHSCTLRIAVKDTGIGIAPEQRSMLFLPFSRLHPAYEGRYPGAGLGLALVKQLMMDLNGRIECRSQPGHGSAFTCFLPLQRVTPTVKKPADLKHRTRLSATDHSSKLSCWRVLYVEDHRLSQIAVMNQLTALQCAVEIAENGAQALSYAAQKNYNLIFLDMGLPDINGCEVVRQIRADDTNPNCHTPMITLTAHAGVDSQQVCLEAGIQRVLNKPLQPDQAREVIEKYAGKSIKRKIK
jgi:two-component system, OmpR family, aerobic respiration control sensor histidine kinase ArcB